MSNIKTYIFNETGVIPGVPGEFHAGLLVDVDLNTMTVVGQRLANAPAIEVQEQPSEDPAPEQSASTEANNIEQGGSEE